jgi:hypothetical protein
MFLNIHTDDRALVLRLLDEQIIANDQTHSVVKKTARGFYLEAWQIDEPDTTFSDH